MEGIDLGLMMETWKELAASESRIELMTKLRELKLGLAEVEEFNLGLNLQFRSEKSRENLAKGENKFVKAAMEAKFRDEIYKSKEITREKNNLRRKLAENLGKNTRKYNREIKILRTEAVALKSRTREKYKEKLNHLHKKYRESLDSKLDKIPEGLQEFSNLSIFDKNKFSEIQPIHYDVKTVGDISLDEDERAILRLHPKFSINQPLQEGNLEFEQEQSYAKVRMELGKELEEKLEDKDKVEMTEQEQELSELLEAQTRQTFDPETRTYDDRKRRVTDLKECSRVTLPRPLPERQEAFLEVRRAVHTRIYDTLSARVRTSL
jgi:hypothetical protein